LASAVLATSLLGTLVVATRLG